MAPGGLGAYWINKAIMVMLMDKTIDYYNNNAAVSVNKKTSRRKKMMKGLIHRENGKRNGRLSIK